MKTIDALVPEIFADLVYTPQSSHDEALEVELVRDPEVETPVEGIVPGNEGTRRRSTIEGLQGRSLHFQEILTVQKTTELRDDLGAVAKYFSDFGIDREIRIPLPVPGFLVREPTKGAAFSGLLIRLGLPEG